MKKEVKNPFLFEEILKDIRSVKIQGAENIAKAGIKAFLMRPTKESANEILSTRPTEPLLQNSIKKLLKSKDPKIKASQINDYIKGAHEYIAKIGAKLIKDDMNVYSHCHSSTVIDILKYAKNKLKKNFVVYTTEVEPLLQGRKTAEDLAKSRIKVVISPDLTAENTLSKCDILLFGSDAYTPKYVVNKIGTSTLTNHAKLLKIPRYSCGLSFKFTKKVNIEYRSPHEVWNIRDKMIKIENPAFDKTPINDLTAVISEYGINSPKEFIKNAKSTFKKF